MYGNFKLTTYLKYIYQEIHFEHFSLLKKYYIYSIKYVFVDRNYKNINLN